MSVGILKHFVYNVCSNLLVFSICLYFQFVCIFNLFVLTLESPVAEWLIKCTYATLNDFFSRFFFLTKGDIYRPFRKIVTAFARVKILFN